MMKVSQMRENIDINRKDADKRTNERTSKILSKTREIEENPFFRHDKRLFRQFLENILGIVILHQCAKFRENI